jgi:hypothetical protein
MSRRGLSRSSPSRLLIYVKLQLRVFPDDKPKPWRFALCLYTSNLQENIQKPAYQATGHPVAPSFSLMHAG